MKQSKLFLMVLILGFLMFSCGNNGKESTSEANSTSDSQQADTVISEETDAGIQDFGLNLYTYNSYSAIVSANPRAYFVLYDGSDPSSINLNNVPSKLGTQFDVFVEEGLEESWGKLKKAYNLNPPEDWVKTGISNEELIEYFAFARNQDDAQVLFLTRTHDDFYSIFKDEWAGFVQEPKGILKQANNIQSRNEGSDVSNIKWEYDATSYYKGEKNANYYPSNLSSRLGLPWASGNGNGVGDIITINFVDNPKNNLILINGYISQDKPDLFFANSRLKTAQITNRTNSKSISVNIEDTKSEQVIDISSLNPTSNSIIEIKALSVYQGEKYPDLCIQAIMPE
jgi:hypothetical protein